MRVEQFAKPYETYWSISSVSQANYQFKTSKSNSSEVLTFVFSMRLVLAYHRFFRI